MKYDFLGIEQKWQAYWQAHKTFAAPNPGDAGFDPAKPKMYVLDMFPYPSGVGLHVGHPLGYIATDIYSRYKRQRGFAVLHPMGYDAFGLPAEQFAVEHGVHPRITTEQNIANMTRQLKRLGLSYDWDRSLATTDPDYYRWTQWIFLQMYNSWFDATQNRARPIAEFEQMLESEQLYIGPGDELIDSPGEGLDAIGGTPIGARKWHELTESQRRQVIDDKRLAFMDEIDVNWCPALGTVLANEEVTNEQRSERGNHPVYRRPLRQWMLRITAYAERLLADLDLVDWPEPIKLMQRNWIGRSEGALVDFVVDGHNELIRVFTTRPDTLFGATYMVMAPEHSLVAQISTDDQRAAVAQYVKEAGERIDDDRADESKAKTGVFTGAYAINPVNEEKIPIWIADYVLMGYGTGAIMAVPAHDDRDFQFARHFNLHIRPVVMPPDDWLKEMVVAQSRDLIREQGDESETGLVKKIASLDDSAFGKLRQDYLEDPGQFTDAFVGEGVGVNSANEEVSLNGVATDQAKRKMLTWLTETNLGKHEVQYKLRDWLFSRQRYWGEPFPIVHTEGGGLAAVDESDLPVQLPEMEDFTPHASDDPQAPVQTPLARADDAWKNIQQDGRSCTRELNTMPQWAGSCWYYLRFCDAGNQQRFADRRAERYWMGGGWDEERDPSEAEPGTFGGVDLYVGGAEHAVLHLLYARFWHKVLFDLGHVSTPEPFARLFNQGYIQAHAFTDERGMYVPADEVKEANGQWLYEGQPVAREFGKMGKSLKNAVTPDEICETYGCDTLRLYEMYLGPLEQSKVWNTRDIIGVHRFLQRLWRNFVDEESGELLVEDALPDAALRKQLHATIRKVTEDMERLSFNTAIAALIELNNALVGRAKLPREVAEAMTLMLAPIAPHMGEELWQRLGHEQTLAYEPWPIFDEALLVEDEVEYPVQVNGKVRGRVTVAANADDQAIEAEAMQVDTVKHAIGEKTVRKVIVIRGRMVNIVAK